MSKYGVFSGPYILVFGLNTERYSVQSEFGKHRLEKTPYFDNFHAVKGNIEDKKNSHNLNHTTNFTIPHRNSVNYNFKSLA